MISTANHKEVKLLLWKLWNVARWIKRCLIFPKNVLNWGACALYYLVRFVNRTKPVTILIETILSGESLCIMTSKRLWLHCGEGMEYKNITLWSTLCSVCGFCIENLYYLNLYKWGDFNENSYYWKLIQIVRISHSTIFSKSQKSY